MKILFVAVGRPRADWAQSALAHYETFLKKYGSSEWRFVRAVSSRDSRTEDVIDAESQRLLEAVRDQPGYRILCERTGKSFSSEALARKIQQGSDERGGRLIVVIGGAWGVADSVRRWAQLLWSFGPGTLPHELALVVAAEQTARALSILRGDSYHK